ncbi:hypothetical protein BX600DRAFT_299007 [Xylariales sp. PMI_506]|nr:hypothetical protein BX600DRAFT_299007 [Xylariales sp. PMI_506]
MLGQYRDVGGWRLMLSKWRVGSRKQNVGEYFLTLWAKIGLANWRILGRGSTATGGLCAEKFSSLRFRSALRSGVHPLCQLTSTGHKKSGSVQEETIIIRLQRASQGVALRKPNYLCRDLHLEHYCSCINGLIIFGGSLVCLPLSVLNLQLSTFLSLLSRS